MRYTNCMDKSKNESVITMDEKIELNSIDEAITAISKGEIIIVVDDENRENEGDFVCAAEKVTPEIINFMATHGRGLICVPLTSERADKLGLNMMAPQNTSHHETAFTISVDYNGQGCTTGISAQDRAICVRELANPEAQVHNFAKPGHIFPLKAKSGGVLERIGHTEASVDLAKLAGLEPAGLLVEILNPDGTMARLPDLMEIAKKHDMAIISIKDLVEYRMKTERLVFETKSYNLPLQAGQFELIIFEQGDHGRQHIALKHGTWTGEDAVPVRVESIRPNQTLLKFIAGSMDDHIRKSLDIMVAEGRGLLVFVSRTDDYRSQVHIADEILLPESEAALSPSEIQKDIGIGAQIILSQNIRNMRLITNNPDRAVPVSGYGLNIAEKIDLSAV